MLSSMRDTRPRFKAPKLTPAHHVDYAHAHVQKWVYDAGKPSSAFLGSARRGPEGRLSRGVEAPAPTSYTLPDAKPQSVYFSDTERFPSGVFPEESIVGVSRAPHYPKADERAARAQTPSALSQVPSYHSSFKGRSVRGAVSLNRTLAHVGPGAYELANKDATLLRPRTCDYVFKDSVVERGVARFSEDLKSAALPLSTRALRPPTPERAPVNPADVWAPAHPDWTKEARHPAAFGKQKRFDHPETALPHSYAAAGPPPMLEQSWRPATSGSMLNTFEATAGSAAMSAGTPAFLSQSTRFVNPCALANGDSRFPRAAYPSEWAGLGPGYTQHLELPSPPKRRRRRGGRGSDSDSDDDDRGGGREAAEAQAAERLLFGNQGTAVFRSVGRKDLFPEPEDYRVKPIGEYAVSRSGTSTSVCPATDQYFKLRNQKASMGAIRKKMEARRRKHKSRSDPIKPV